jgi:hypothetical protein
MRLAHGSPASREFRFKIKWFTSSLAQSVRSLLFAAFVFWSTRWSFLVYPNRIRVRGRRRAVDIPFEEITGVQMISYQHQLTPGVLWTELKIYFDPRYPKYGLGQTRVLRGVREILRLECAHHGWKKGYYLDMEEPRPFLETLNRALKRHRLTQKSPTTPAAPR